jgi:outer membrane receptor protein involved in Fe transport
LKSNQKLSSAILAVLSVHAAGSAHAAAAATDASAANSDAIADIVVTAQRRSESIQDVPITIQALTGDTLKELNISTADDFIKYLPNVSLATNGPGQGNIFMRGLALGSFGTQSSGTIGGFPNVAVYLDEQSGQLPSRNLDVYAADLERIEVLEGPQGTLFGGGAEAGVIRYITNKPKLNVTEGSAEASYGTTAHGDPNSSVNAVINLPLIQDTLAIRAVVYSDERGGYINNVPSTFTRSANDYGIYYAGYATGCSVGSPVNGACTAKGASPTKFGPPPNSPVANNYDLAANAINPVTYKGLRVGALWQINDDWNALVTQSYQAMQADGVFYEMPHGSDYGVNPSAPQVLPPLSVTTFSPSYDKDSFENTALTVNGKIGDFKLVYSGGYLSRSITQAQDYTNYARGVYADYYQCYGAYAGSPTCFSPVSSWQESETNTHQTHELRLSSPDDRRIRGLVGAFYEDYKITDDTEWLYKTVPTCTTGGSPDCFQDVQPVPGSVVANPNPRNDNVAFFEDTHRDIKQTAFFASVDVDLIPKVLVLTGGARHYDYSEDFGGTVVSSFGCFNYAATPTVGPCTNFKYSANISGYNLNSSFTGTKYRGNLTWHVTPDTMVYYTYSQGYRPGGFNRSTGFEAPDANGIPQYIKPLTVSPDSLINNEVGFKTQFLEHRLQIDGSIYDEKWSNVQTGIFNPQYFGNTTFGLNGPNYEVKGIELQITGKVTQALTLIASGSWNRSQQTTSPPLVDNNCANNPNRALLNAGSSNPVPVSPTCGQPITQLVEPNGQLGSVIDTFGAVGVPTAFSPPMQYNARARYDFVVGDYKSFWQVGMLHVGHEYNNSNTQPAINGDVLWPAGTPITTTTWRFEMPGYTTFDASIGTGKDNWTVQLFGTNITDVNASQFTSTSQFVKTEVPIRPRVLGLKLGMKF